MSERGHRSVAHTADVILEAWGRDLAACCEEATAALTEVYLDAVDRAALVEHRALDVGPGSPDDLLIAVLEDIIFVLETSLLVPIGATARAVGEEELTVNLSLANPASVEPAGAVPKAISLDGLHHGTC